MAKDKSQKTERNIDADAAETSQVIDAAALFRERGPEVKSEENFDDFAFPYGDMAQVNETAPDISKRIGAVSDVRGHVLSEAPSPLPDAESMKIFEMFQIGAVRNGALQFIQVLLDKIIDLIDRALMAANLPTLAAIAKKIGSAAKGKIEEMADAKGLDIRNFRSVSEIA